MLRGISGLPILSAASEDYKRKGKFSGNEKKMKKPEIREHNSYILNLIPSHNMVRSNRSSFVY